MAEHDLTDVEIHWVKRQAELAATGQREFQWRLEAEKVWKDKYSLIYPDRGGQAFIDGWVAALRAARVTEVNE
jgi:hypothetical protein